MSREQVRPTHFEEYEEAPEWTSGLGDEEPRFRGLVRMIRFSGLKMQQEIQHTGFDRYKVCLVEFVASDWVGPVFCDVFEDEAALVYFS